MAEALEIDINDTALIEALWANREAIQNLSNEYVQQEQERQLLAENTAREIMADSQYH
jgi:hypothetical protein